MRFRLFESMANGENVRKRCQDDMRIKFMHLNVVNSRNVFFFSFFENYSYENCLQLEDLVIPNTHFPVG